MDSSRREKLDSQTQTLKKLLDSLAGVRQAKLEPDTRDLYANALKGYDTRHVAEAVRELGMAPRQQYEPAFPELGAIIAKTEYLRDARKNNAKFVSCDECFYGWRQLRDGVVECQCLRRYRDGTHAYVPDPTITFLEALDRGEQWRHPERFIPVTLCWQVGQRLAKARMDRDKAGNPMTPEEYRSLKKKLTAEMNAAWVKQVEDERTVVA
jgi:hypothetical protein